MQGVTAATKVDDRNRTLRVAFASSVVSLVAAFAAVGSTIPLFNIHRAEDGFTNAAISLTVVAYSVATLGTLLVLGRVSTRVRRRPAAIASLGLLMLGCLLFLNVHDIGILIVGRLLMGLGAGLASSSLAAYIVDAADTGGLPPSPLRSLPSLHTTRTLTRPGPPNMESYASRWERIRIPSVTKRGQYFAKSTQP